MKEVTVKDLETNYRDAVIIDCSVDQIVGSNIADLVYMAKHNYVIIVTPWDEVTNYDRYDPDDPHTWCLSNLFYHLHLYNIEFDGWEYKEDLDYSERDYFRISGFTANKELLEDMESVMHTRFEFDIAYGGMYNFDENYNIQ